MKNISILGVTGSIGKQTLEVIRCNKDKFNIIGVSCNERWQDLIPIVEEFMPKMVCINHSEAYDKFSQYCSDKGIEVELLSGMDGMVKICTLREVDIVLTSVMGMVGLKPTLAAIKAGKQIALANKETLVVGGEIITQAAREHGVHILPVDSEHSAVFQCLQGNEKNKVDKIILTASGGPFRGSSKEDLKRVTVEDALKHPNWVMGSKITIDSATLMNKGLEVIEAHWLFDTSYDDIEVVVHPQSVIHSMVEYVDGSIIAQLGSADMRLPIHYALFYPERIEGNYNKLNVKSLISLTFEKPDTDTFKCLALALEAGKKGALYPTILNGANEAAVELFLKKSIDFVKIPEIIEECLNRFDGLEKLTIDTIIAKDKRVKDYIYSKYGV